MSQSNRPHWATEYIGLPWSADGEGPRHFHCWSFVRHIQAAHYSRALPAIDNPHDLIAQARTFKNHPERARWSSAPTPQDGDCVLLRRSRVPVHIGVWLDVDGGGVLHCAQGPGVVFQRLPALENIGWQVSGFYRFTGDS